MSKHRYFPTTVIRRVKNGRVKVFGHYYAPPSCPERFEGLWMRFALNYSWDDAGNQSLEPFLYCRERADWVCSYNQDTQTGEGYDPFMRNDEHKFAWMFWDRIDD